MVKLEEIKELHNFESKYTFSQLQQYLPQRSASQIHDDGLYKAVKTLTEKAHPTEESDYEKRWHDFHVPLKRNRYFILVPLPIILYDKRFFLCFQRSQVEVCKGKDRNDFFSGLIEQTVKFSRILRKAPSIIMQAIPYDIRTGRVLGRYVLENLLPAEGKKKILKLYGNHVQMGTTSRGVSLNDYLNTAALCYKASFGGKTKGLTAEQMYRKWADNRDCGMLEIRNKKSHADFSSWLNHKSHCGGHPFEIVFSWHSHGIHLYPPRAETPHYKLRVTNYMYALSFLEMVKALIRNRIPFEAHELDSVLDYLSGESYFTVNTYDKHSISYDPSDRKLVKHIEWDAPNVLTWK